MFLLIKTLRAFIFIFMHLKGFYNIFTILKSSKPYIFNIPLLLQWLQIILYLKTHTK